MRDFFVKIETFAILFVCVALAGLMVVQIILRYVFVAPFVGIEEAAALLGVWIYFLGMIHITRTRRHLSSGVFQLYVSNHQMLRGVEIFKAVLCVLSFLLFFKFSVDYVVQTYESGRTSTYLSWPWTIWVSSMAVGFGVSSLFFIRDLVQVLKGTPRDTDEPTL